MSSTFVTIPSRLHVASTMLWFTGILEIIGAVFMGVPSVASSGQVPFYVVLGGLFGLVLCVGGFLMRRQRSSGRMLAIGALIGLLLVRLMVGSLFTLLSVITTTTLVLVVRAKTGTGQAAEGAAEHST